MVKCIEAIERVELKNSDSLCSFLPGCEANIAVI